MLKKPNREYFRIFLTVASCILFYFLLANFSQVSDFVKRIAKVFNPVLYGFVIAYLLNPVMKFLVRGFTKLRKKEKPTRGIRVVSLICTYVIALLLAGAILLIVVPQLIESLTTLANNFNTYASNFSAWLTEVTARLENFTGNEFIQNALEGSASYLKGAVSDLAGVLVKKLPDLMSFLTGLGTALGAFLFGMFLSFYMLFDKENLIARVKKTVYTLFRKGTANNIVLFFRETDETVGNFISGKLLDSLIIGLLSYVVFLIFGIPFAGLFAVIAGITNIIPIFGPIIGAVINGLLLLIVSPGQLIPYIIIVVVIQQLDGNLIGPKILGKVTGLSGFWVMIALTVGGGLFGIWGMILAVPVFTVLYRGFGKLVNTSLESSGLPSDTAYYTAYPPVQEAPAGEEKKKKRSFKDLFRRKKKKGGENGAEGAETPVEGAEAPPEDPAAGSGDAATEKQAASGEKSHADS